MFVKSRSDW